MKNQGSDQGSMIKERIKDHGSMIKDEGGRVDPEAGTAGRPAIHTPSRDIDVSSKNRFWENRKFYKINIFDINRLLDHKLITETSKFGICVKNG